MIDAETQRLRRITAAQGWQVLQSLTLVAVISMVYFGTKPLNAFLLIFLFCGLLNIRSAKDDIRKNAVFILLCLQYPLVQLVKINFIDDPIPGALYYSVAKSRMWVWGGIIAILSLIFFCRVKNLSRQVDVVIPPILLLTFGTLSYEYWRGAEYYADWQGGGCRIKGLHRSIFDAPLIFTTLTVIFLRNIDVKSRGARGVGYVLVACSLVMTIAFAGARSVAVAQIATYALCCLILALTLADGRRLALQVLGSVVLGVIVGLGLIYFVDCGANSVARILEPRADVSVLQRSTLYLRSLELIAERPMLGYGITYESLVADRPHKHVHNMYLSWGLWGGAISLVSGLMFLSAIFWGNLGEMRQTNALILVLALLGPWGISQLFDSFFVWPYLFYIFIVYLCLGQALLVREVESRHH